MDNNSLAFHEALSGICASISLVSWTCFLIPQLLENRRNQSGEAVSLSSVLIRFAGDICNLVGALLANLISGTIVIGTEYCLSDLLLITQILYYSIQNRRKEGKNVPKAILETFKGNLRSADAKPLSVTQDGPSSSEYPKSALAGNGYGDDENTPLIRCHARPDNFRHLSSQQRCGFSRRNLLDRVTELLDESQTQSQSRIWFKDLVVVLAICTFAIIGWTLAYRFGGWVPKIEQRNNMSDNQTTKVIATSAQLLGYMSAGFSLSSRVPQILKNWRNKSCEGLSLLFFLLSFMGNMTYGASILFHSTEKSYVIKNTPWIVGSLGCVAQEFFIFFQFHLYRKVGV